MQRGGFGAALLAAAAGVLFAGGVLLFDGEQGLFPLLDTREKLRRVENRTRATEAERRQLRRRVEALNSDPFAVEREARRKLGMLRDGERVIRWPDPPPGTD